MTLIPELEQELTRAITETIPARGRSRLRRLPVMVPVAATLAGTAVALAATGVIKLGSPERESSGRPNVAAEAETGLGTISPANSELLALRVKDPGSLLPWGLRISRTSRGLGCVRAGLVLNGRLGALGVDGDFANDGFFHPFPTAGTPRLIGCVPLDSRGELFISASEADVPTSASALHRCTGAGGQRKGSAERPLRGQQYPRHLLRATRPTRHQSHLQRRRNDPHGHPSRLSRRVSDRPPGGSPRPQRRGHRADARRTPDHRGDLPRRSDVPLRGW